MKRSALLLPVLLVLGLATTSLAGPRPTAPAALRPVAPRPANDDTILVRLPNQATMTLYVKNKAQLRELRNYKLDSLIVLLDTYISQAEKASKNSTSEQVTMEFYPAKDQPGKQVPEQIRITMHNDPGNNSGGRTTKSGDHVDVTLGRVFGVTVEENTDGSGNDRVSVRVGSSAKSDSVRTAERKAKQEEKANRAVHSNFDIDLGLNALTNKQRDLNGNALDLRPVASRYISLNWHYDIRLGRKGSALFLRTGPELAFNNYMLDNNYQFVNLNGITVLQKPAEVGRNLEKSKLSVSSINLPLMPMLSFQDRKGHDSFRIGAGGFVGYRLGSHTKLKYEDDGSTKKDKDRGSYNLEDFQYGVQGTIGIRSIDLFAKYNLNNVFKDNRGPQAQTISFGLSLLQ